MKTNLKGFLIGCALTWLITLFILLCSCEPTETGPSIITDADTIVIIIRGK